MIPTLTLFCCGCSVSTGAIVIMAFHLLACLVVVGTAFATKVFRVEVPMHIMVSEAGLPADTCHIGLCLVGLPLTIAGIYGVRRGADVCVRTYYYYLLFCCLVDIYRVLSFFVFSDVCDMKAEWVVKVANATGEAFVCGAERTVGNIIVATVVGAEVYSLWIVWSLLEDDAFQRPELFELLPSKAHAIGKAKWPLAHHSGPYDDIVGLAQAELPGAHGFGYRATQSGMPA
eukprot:TRINITY_DN36546_c0_g1_i2.p1 TRINITY_DN36546_c0_g1~~TRINITY_DN36546_c0_g1_i2.p1  ORF type:complete len:230 (-),score=53.95 TRINITY_DN36546_c0_g1_i2:82-771(-)